jgi:hypothetical protein
MPPSEIGHEFVFTRPEITTLSRYVYSNPIPIVRHVKRDRNQKSPSMENVVL